MIYWRLHVISCISRNLYFPANTNSLHLKLECIMERIFNKKILYFAENTSRFKFLWNIYMKKVYIYSFLINTRAETNSVNKRKKIKIQ